MRKFTRIVGSNDRTLFLPKDVAVIELQGAVSFMDRADNVVGAPHGVVSCVVMGAGGMFHVHAPARDVVDAIENDADVRAEWVVIDQHFGSPT